MLTLMPESWEEAPTYGEAVRRILEEHGCTYRSQRQRTGLPHSTVASWINDGVPPSEKSAAQFAEGFGLNLSRWMRKAGYPSPEAPEAPQDLFWRLYGEMVRLLDAQGIEPIMPTLDIRSSRWDDLTEEQIREMVDGLEARSREKHAAKQGEPPAE